MIIYKNILILILFNIIVISGVKAEVASYRIFFRDKGPEEFAPGTGLYDNTLKIHSNKCIKRRNSIDSKTPFTITDAPVYKAYTDIIEKFGVKIRLQLRWKNYIVAECDSVTAYMIAGLEFVKKVSRASTRFSPASNSEIPDGNENDDYVYENITHNGCGSFYYGESANQLDMLNIIKLHGIGVTGQGVLIGLIDTGFDTGISTLSHTDILGAYDFVNNDTVVADDKKDSKPQDSHGTMVLSAIAAFTHDNLIGAAPFSSFLLAKTEDLNTERLIEEDNLAAAVEWLESGGADIISVSLSYNKLDSTDESHSPEDFDGKTTIAATSLNEATKRGVVCVVSAGNKGPASHTIYTPADADSAITVGAVMPDGTTPVVFTSRGFMPDGNIKPDVAAQGKDVITVHPEKKHLFFRAEGTSFSAPLIAGAVALMLSVHPEMKPWQVKDALRQNASLKNKPDTALGFGVPDVFEATRKFGTIITPPAVYPSKTKLNIMTNIYAENESEIKFHYRNRKESIFVESSPERNGLYTYISYIPLKYIEDTVEIYLTVRDSKGIKRYPGDDTKYLRAVSNSTLIPCGVGDDMLYDYFPDFTAGVYPNVINEGNSLLNVYINLILNSTVKIKIFSADGRQVYSENHGYFNIGMNHIPVELNNLSSGVYILEIDNVTDYEHIKFIVLN